MSYRNHRVPECSQGMYDSIPMFSQTSDCGPSCPISLSPPGTTQSKATFTFSAGGREVKSEKPGHAFESGVNGQNEAGDLEADEDEDNRKRHSPRLRFIKVEPPEESELDVSRGGGQDIDRYSSQRLLASSSNDISADAYPSSSVDSRSLASGHSRDSQVGDFGMVGDTGNPVMDVSSSSKTRIEQILEQVQSLSNADKLLLYLMLPAGDSEDVDPIKAGQNPLGSRNEISITINWIQTHLEENPDISLPKHEIYQEYSEFCTRVRCKALSTADFGKVMKQVYPGVKPRRLGVRGHSRYCYSGLQKRHRLADPSLPNLTLPSSSPPSPLMSPVHFPSPRTREEEIQEPAIQVVQSWASEVLGRRFTSMIDLAGFIVEKRAIEAPRAAGKSQRMATCEPSGSCSVAASSTSDPQPSRKPSGGSGPSKSHGCGPRGPVPALVPGQLAQEKVDRRQHHGRQTSPPTLKLIPTSSESTAEKSGAGNSSQRKYKPIQPKPPSAAPAPFQQSFKRSYTPMNAGSAPKVARLESLQLEMAQSGASAGGGGGASTDRPSLLEKLLSSEPALSSQDDEELRIYFAQEAACQQQNDPSFSGATSNPLIGSTSDSTLRKLLESAPCASASSAQPPKSEATPLVSSSSTSSCLFTPIDAITEDSSSLDALPNQSMLMAQMAGNQNLDPAVISSNSIEDSPFISPSGTPMSRSRHNSGHTARSTPAAFLDNSGSSSAAGIFAFPTRQQHFQQQRVLLNNNNGKGIGGHIGKSRSCHNSGSFTKGTGFDLSPLPLTLHSTHSSYRRDSQMGSLTGDEMEGGSLSLPGQSGGVLSPFEDDVFHCSTDGDHLTSSSTAVATSTTNSTLAADPLIHREESFDGSIGEMSPVRLHALEQDPRRHRHYSALAAMQYSTLHQLHHRNILPLESDGSDGAHAFNGGPSEHLFLPGDSHSHRPQSVPVPVHTMMARSHPTTPSATSDVKQSFNFDYTAIQLSQASGVPQHSNSSILSPMKAAYGMLNNPQQQSSCSDDSGVETLSGGSMAGEANRDRNPSQQSDMSSISGELSLIPQSDPFMGGTCNFSQPNPQPHQPQPNNGGGGNLSRSYPNTPIPAAAEDKSVIHQYSTAVNSPIGAGHRVSHASHPHNLLINGHSDQLEPISRSYPTTPTSNMDTLFGSNSTNSGTFTESEQESVFRHQGANVTLSSLNSPPAIRLRFGSSGQAVSVQSVASARRNLAPLLDLPASGMDDLGSIDLPDCDTPFPFLMDGEGINGE
ncbi:unnamed protein product [Cyprideis torosa]|uniref:Uncharacterized protein n=1 Tax=Cyprideis torosa TaxID=163714 RepID=A0A7R8WKQ7_9CRUS|nr:unnamed protein product [Cyprideis torosa]CAG0900724.1 unnamed protein product [Cyprideis torosa]